MDCSKKSSRILFLTLTKSRVIPIFLARPIHLENTMIHLSESARAELEAFFANRPKSGIRIYLAPGG